MRETTLELCVFWAVLGYASRVLVGGIIGEGLHSREENDFRLVEFFGLSWGIQVVRGYNTEGDLTHVRGTTFEHAVFRPVFWYSSGNRLDESCKF